MRRRVRWLGPVRLAGVSVLACAAATSAGCGQSHSASVSRALAHAQTAVAPRQHSEPPAPSPQLDGQSFPDHVLALTWDDGPDKHTLELARYLRGLRVSGTFFVVESWRQDLSDYPGTGDGVFDSGYGRLPVLGDLVRLRQRVANHTLNHVVLSSAEPELVITELSRNQREIDRFLTNEERLFRAPCGAWGSDAARATQADPYLRQLTGPIRWDIDAKDWESSIQCKSSAPARDCEPFPGGLRLKPRVTARRYLEAIERVGRGIVLLHDRVADVGSSYALEVARALVPGLIARGYVFAAPVLGFSPLVERAAESAQAWLAERPLTRLRLADADGDGRADLCGETSAQIVCLKATQGAAAPGDALQTASFGEPEPIAPQHWLSAALADAPEPSALTSLADVNGDGRADACWGGSDGVHCALAQRGTFASATLWLAGPTSTPLFGDLNGDGRADVCVRVSRGVNCALSTGSSFTAATSWLGGSEMPEGAWLGLGDINGDGRADLCRIAGGHVACGLAP